MATYNWTFGFRVADGQVKEDRADGSMSSLNIIEGSELDRDTEAALEGAFAAIDHLGLDDHKPYQVVFQGSRAGEEVTIRMTLATENI